MKMLWVPIFGVISVIMLADHGYGRTLTAPMKYPQLVQYSYDSVNGGRCQIGMNVYVAATSEPWTLALSNGDTLSCCPCENVAHIRCMRYRKGYQGNIAAPSKCDAMPPIPKGPPPPP